MVAVRTDRPQELFFVYIASQKDLINGHELPRMRRPG